MPSPRLSLTSALLLLAFAAATYAAPTDSQAPERALDQTQMVPTAQNPFTGESVNANGTALPNSSGHNTQDDSFGEQVILKSQERSREFLFGADASVFYTSNAALTRRDEVSDMFFVANAGLSWTHAINRALQFQIGGHASIFRYNDTPALDFDNLGGGIGLIWTPPIDLGIALFGRYDFVQLLTRDGHDLLTDHEFSAGAQKVIVLGRAHALSFSLGGAVGIADPGTSQRDTFGGGVSYQLRLTRNLDTSVAYRLAGYFYNEGDRMELNQLASLSLNYHFNRLITASAFASYGDNRSNRSAFDYKVFAGGGGASLTVQF